MYESDTFFHLSMTGRIGLVLLSSLMGLATLWSAWRLSRGTRFVIRLLIGLGAFAVFDWLAPQAHYLWYRQVIEGLPLQWVIAPWPDIAASVDVLAFQAGASLSAHTRAALGWLCILAAYLSRRTGAPALYL